MRTPPRKWLLPVLAVILSVGGGPAVWAKAFIGYEAALMAAADGAPAHCPGSADQHAAPQPDSMQDPGAPSQGHADCCDDGGCGCASSASACATARSNCPSAAVRAAELIVNKDLAEPFSQLLRPPRS